MADVIKRSEGLERIGSFHKCNPSRQVVFFWCFFNDSVCCFLRYFAMSVAHARVGFELALYKLTNKHATVADILLQQTLSGNSSFRSRSSLQYEKSYFSNILNEKWRKLLTLPVFNFMIWNVYSMKVLFKGFQTSCQPSKWRKRHKNHSCVLVFVLQNLESFHSSLNKRKNLNSPNNRAIPPKPVVRPSNNIAQIQIITCVIRNKVATVSNVFIFQFQSLVSVPFGTTSDNFHIWPSQVLKRSHYPD